LEKNNAKSGFNRTIQVKSDFMVWQIIGIGVGAAVITGVTIAIVAKEVINDNDTLIEKAETSLVRLGFVSEGIVKGAIVSVPPCLVALLVLNYGMKAQKRLVGA
tara:strand:- start:540 stop:851 length:312 start_codon:yes stop_codon:yes gene_type:complete